MSSEEPKVSQKLKDKIERTRTEALNIALGENLPDTDETERTVASFYNMFGMETPKMVWVRSPEELHKRIDEYSQKLKGGLTKSELEKIESSSPLGRTEKSFINNRFAEKVKDFFNGHCMRILHAVPKHIAQELYETFLNQGYKRRAAVIDEAITTKMKLTGGDAPKIITSAHFTLECAMLRIVIEELFYDGMFCSPFPNVARYAEVIAKNVFYWFPTEEVSFFCIKPSQLAMDERNRLHNPSGPALLFRDGFNIHAIDGVFVPNFVIYEPEKITANDVDTEQNAEVRRIMVKRFPNGWEGYLKASKAKKVHTDDWGTLYTKKYKDNFEVGLVQVICPSTQREYVLPVNLVKIDREYGERTARAAIASTWRVRGERRKLLFSKPEHYNPDEET